MFTWCGIKDMKDSPLQPLIMKATELMQNAEAWLTENMRSLEAPADFYEAIGHLDVRLVMLVHGFQYKLPATMQYESLAESC